MNTVILVNSKLNDLENYKDQYKIFTNKEEALLFAKRRAKSCGLELFMLNSVDDLKVGMMFYCEASKQFVKVIEIKVE
jgi:hypothetical protein